MQSKEVHLQALIPAGFSSILQAHSGSSTDHACTAPRSKRPHSTYLQHCRSY